VELNCELRCDSVRVTRAGSGEVTKRP